MPPSFPFPEKATLDTNTDEDWGLIMNICDKINTVREGQKDSLKAITKRLQHQDPHVVMQAITVKRYWTEIRGECL